MADTLDTTAPVGERLRDLRRRSGRSLRAVAAAAGVSHQHLGQVETGRAKASAAAVGRIVAALGGDPADFADGDRAPGPTAPAGGAGARSYDEAAGYLGISVSKLKELVRERRIAFARIGARVVFPEACLAAFLHQATVAVQQAPSPRTVHTVRAAAESR